MKSTPEPRFRITTPKVILAWLAILVVAVAIYTLTHPATH